MSLLMFQCLPEEIVIANDTLACRVGGQPSHLSSKAVVVPHLGAVISGLGIQPIVKEWTSLVMWNAALSDFHSLGAMAERELPKIHAEVMEGTGLDNSTTIYHFGYSEVFGRYVYEVFRSVDGFKTETHAHDAFGFKPNVGELEDYKDLTPDTLDEWLPFAIHLRDEQDQRPVEERIFIGGELVFIGMGEGRITSWRGPRFDDFDADWQACINGLGDPLDGVIELQASD